MAQVEGDLDNGAVNGALASLAAIEAIALAWMARR
jgi:hypothetical protein